MRNKIIWLFLSVVVCASGMVAQGDESLSRGNAGRTGEFNVIGIEAFNKVLWKSPQLFNIKEDPERNIRYVTVLGEKFRYYQSHFFFAWPFPMGHIEKVSTPLVHRETIFFSRNFYSEEIGDGFVFAINAKTGKPVWSYRCAKCYVSDPVAYKDWLIITARSYSKDRTYEGKIQALNILTGSVEWTFSVDHVSLLEPTLHNGILYFMRGLGYVDGAAAQSAETGIYAFDLNTRAIKWGYETTGAFDTPAISNDELFIASNKDYLYALDLETGREKWKFKATARAPVARDGTVYFSDSSNVYAVDTETGLLKWKQRDSGGLSTFLAVSKSAIYYGGDRNFRSIDSATGKVKWSIGIKGDAFEPVIVNDRVLAGGTEELLMLDAETGKRFPTVSLGPNVANTPAIMDGFLIVDNGDGYLFAIKK